MNSSGRKWTGWHEMKWNDTKGKEIQGNKRKREEMIVKDRKWKDLKENENGIPREKYGNRKVWGNGQEMDWNDSNGSERQIKGNERAWK